MNIFRNRFLNTASFLLAPPDMPNENEDNRSEAQKQRDAIEISDSTDEKNNKDSSSSSDELSLLFFSSVLSLISIASRCF